VSEPELKQRLAAILVADVAGYSRLMSTDDRATVKALDAARAVFRSQIESHHGRVIDMAGDSVLAVFETANGAVSAAIEIQRQVNALAESVPQDRRMCFRIGLHLGDVIEKADGTVYGDGVNIAARLEGLAEPGGITISDAVHGAVRGKVSAGFEDQGEQSVKNIVDPVHAYRVGKPIAPSDGATAARRPAPGAGGSVLALPDKPSIAVLPFANMSSDPEQEFFADGITEDIIAALSRYDSLFVVARNSSFVFRGQSVDSREVGEKLGVRFVLEGSVRKAAQRIRVTAQLISAASGELVWADRFEGDLADVFALQDEISRTIVSTIAGRLEDSQSKRLLQIPTRDLSAYEAVLRGQKYLHQFTRLDYECASECFLQAIAADEHFARAYGLLACVLVYMWFWDSDQGPDGLARAASAGEKGLVLDPHDRHCHVALGMTHLFLMAHDSAEYHLARARDLNPNDDLIMVEQGRLYMYLGRPDAGADLVRTAMRRNPFHPNWYWNILGRCLHSAGNHDAAIPIFESVINPPFWTHAYMAACYAANGDAGKSAEHVAATLSLRPDFTVAGFIHQIPYRNPADLQHFVEMLHVADLPR